MRFRLRVIATLLAVVCLYGGSLAAQEPAAPAASENELASVKKELQAEKDKAAQQQQQIAQLQQQFAQLQQQMKPTREQLMQQAFDGYSTIFKDAYDRIQRACKSVKKGHGSVTVDELGKPRSVTCSW